jgi:hypothetical protein
MSHNFELIFPFLECFGSEMFHASMCCMLEWEALGGWQNEAKTFLTVCLIRMKTIKTIFCAFFHSRRTFLLLVKCSLNFTQRLWILFCVMFLMKFMFITRRILRSMLCRCRRRKYETFSSIYPFFVIFAKLFRRIYDWARSARVKNSNAKTKERRKNLFDLVKWQTSLS